MKNLILIFSLVIFSILTAQAVSDDQKKINIELDQLPSTSNLYKAQNEINLGVTQIRPESRQFNGNHVSSLYNNLSPPNNIHTANFISTNSPSLTNLQTSNLINALTSNNAATSLLNMLKSQQGGRRSLLTNKLKNFMSSLFWKDNSNSLMSSGSSYSFAFKQPPLYYHTSNNGLSNLPISSNPLNGNLATFANLGSASQYRPVILPNYSSNNYKLYNNALKKINKNSGTYQPQLVSASSNSNNYWNNPNLINYVNGLQSYPSSLSSSALTSFNNPSGSNNFQASSNNINNAYSLPNSNSYSNQFGSLKNLNKNLNTNYLNSKNQYKRSSSGQSNFKPINSNVHYPTSSTTFGTSLVSSSSSSSVNPGSINSLNNNPVSSGSNINKA